MSNFVLEFKLRTEIYQEHILWERFEIGRKIYNTLVTIIVAVVELERENKNLSSIVRFRKRSTL